MSRADRFPKLHEPPPSDVILDAVIWRALAIGVIAGLLVGVWL